MTPNAAGLPRVRRGLVALGTLALLYGLVAELGHHALPHRIVIAVHELEVDLLPPFSSLADELGFLVQAGLLQGSILVSGRRVLLGLVLGAGVGLPLGFAMAWARTVEALAEPWVVFFRFTPALALLPLYALWFGFGELSRVLLIATGAAVVMLQGAFDGVRAVPRVYLDAGAALGAPRRLLASRILLPASLPHVLASIRIAVALAWVAMVFAELLEPTMPSLGYLLVLSSAYPRVSTTLLALLTIGVLVLLSDALVLVLYGRATRWMRRRDG